MTAEPLLILEGLGWVRLATERRLVVTKHHAIAANHIGAQTELEAVTVLFVGDLAATRILRLAVLVASGLLELGRGGLGRRLSAGRGVRLGRGCRPIRRLGFGG